MSFDYKKYIQNNPLLKEDEVAKKEYTEDELKYSLGVDDDYEGWVDLAFSKGFKYDEHRDIWTYEYNLEEDDVKFVDQEWDPETQSLTSTVKYLPNFEKAYDDLEDAKKSIEAVASKDELINDKQIKRIKDLVRDAFNKYRTHLRNNYRDEYLKIKGRGGVDEMSTSVGAGAYLTPYAFKKKRKKSNDN